MINSSLQNAGLLGGGIGYDPGMSGGEPDPSLLGPYPSDQAPGVFGPSWATPATSDSPMMGAQPGSDQQPFDLGQADQVFGDTFGIPVGSGAGAGAGSGGAGVLGANGYLGQPLGQDPWGYMKQMEDNLAQERDIRDKIAKVPIVAPTSPYGRPGNALLAAGLGILGNALDRRNQAGAQLVQGFQQRVADDANRAYQTQVQQRQQTIDGLKASLEGYQDQNQLLGAKNANATANYYKDQGLSITRAQLERQMSRDDASDLERFLGRLGTIKDPTRLQQQLVGFETTRKQLGRPLPDGWDAIKSQLVTDATAQYNLQNAYTRLQKDAKSLDGLFARATNKAGTYLPATYRSGLTNDYIKQLTAHLIDNPNKNPDIQRFNDQIQAQIDGAKDMLPDLSQQTDAEATLQKKNSQLDQKYRMNQQQISLNAEKLKWFDSAQRDKAANIMSEIHKREVDAQNWGQTFAARQDNWSRNQYLKALSDQTPLIDHQKNVIQTQIAAINKAVGAGSATKAQNDQLTALQSQLGDLETKAQDNQSQMNQYRQTFVNPQTGGIVNPNVQPHVDFIRQKLSGLQRGTPQYAKAYATAAQMFKTNTGKDLGAYIQP